MQKPAPMTREELSWILYDVANSAFVLVMITAVMPIYFKDVAAHGIDNAVSTANWGFANSAASLILALSAPILGALADYKDRKKVFFLCFLCFGLSFNVALASVSAGQWLRCLLLFICARVGWAGANIFYDAFLVDVTTGKRFDLISARGYAMGYIGSVIPFLIVIGLILSADNGQTGLPVTESRIGFLIVALWWLLFSIPAALNLTQRHYVPTSDSPVSDGFRRFWSTCKNIGRKRQTFMFLLAYFFYIDGVHTIISMSTAYGRDLGFEVNMLIMVLMVIQIVAFPFSLLFGRLALRHGTKTILSAGIGIFCLATFLAFLLPAIDDLQIKTALFWTIALLIASSMGGVQALSRSWFATLIPAEKSAEFFGFYNVFGKFAAILGPLLMGVVGRLTGDTRWGVLSLLLLFIIGGVLLLRVEEPQ